MNELIKRIVFGLVFLAVVFVPYVLDVHYHLATFPLVLLFFTLVGVNELYRMAAQTGASKRTLYSSTFVAILAFFPALLVSSYEFGLHQILPFSIDTYKSFHFPVIFLVVQLIIVLFFSILIFRKASVKSIYKHTFLLSILYPILPFSILATAYVYWKPGPLFFALVPIYLNDSLAYATGRLFGKHKLIPSVSPKKTWEGFIGGIVGTVLLTNLLVYLLEPGLYDLHQAILFTSLSVLASILATLGDLFESKLKRAAEVKDSGNILPGHGGVLDRTDAMLFVAPVLYLLLQLIF